MHPPLGAIAMFSKPAKIAKRIDQKTFETFATCVFFAMSWSRARPRL
jgi:hypothetical protein